MRGMGAMNRIIRAAGAAQGAQVIQRQLEEAHMRPLQWPIIKRMLGFMRPYKAMYVAGMLCIVATHLLGLAPAILIKRGIDLNIMGEDYVLGGPMAGDMAGLVFTGLILAGVAVLNYLSHAGQDWFLRMSGECAVRDMRRDVFNKIQGLDMASFDRWPLGRLLTRGSSDVQVLHRVLVFTFSMAVGSMVTLVGAFAVMLQMNWRLFIIVLIVSPFLYIASSVFRQRARPAWRRVRRDVSRLTANVAEMVSGVRVVQAYNREDENLDRFDNINMVFWRSNMRVARYQGWYLMVVESVAVLCLAGLLGYGGWKMVSTAGTKEAMTVGTLFGFFMLASQVFEPLRRLAPIYNEVLHAMASGERVFALLDIQTRIQDADDATDLPRIDGHVRFDHVDFEYVAGQPVLKDISFDVPPGQTLALVGHTGCGKTTIISLLNRFYDVTGGSITIDGHDIRQVTQQSLHDQTGLILQENFLFEGTVMQNLKYARPDVSDEEVFHTCEQLGCHEIFSALGRGYETQVGERGENLSSGQRQLVSIARAMVANPRLLMLDEATSSVDTQTERAIQYALERLMERRTCFTVAHRLSTVRKAHQILVIDHGRIIERGTHAELLAMGGSYAKLHAEFMKTGDEQ
ncbi:MAG: ABC transporter ATP-binding protein [Planctomycetes bacterium]|nr:ABC transporter ATP-binding protein [Planctomycetota bacterium]